MNRACGAFAVTALLASCAAGAAPRPRWGVAVEGNPVTPAQLATLAAAPAPRPAFVVFFVQWPERPASGSFPAASVAAIASAGATPVITWEPMYYRALDGAETMIPAAAIVDGRYDRYIEEFARGAAQTRQPLLIRFAHEMNLSRYHWGGTAAEFGPAAAERYRAMWRHVVEVFRRVGAPNVQWAFCPNCESVPGAGNLAAAPWNTARAYYPGNDCVDVVGMDGYNWGDTQTPEKNGWRSSWRSFEATFAPLRRELAQLAPGKPLWVFETASAPSGGDKTAWLDAMAHTARDWQLAGVAWFDVAKEVDWRLRTGVNATALEPLHNAFDIGNR